MENNDWRITNQKNYLMNVKVIRVDTSCLSSDHEHCVFCWDKFSKNKNSLINLYSTIDLKHWICEKCFDDFKKEFNWHVINADNIKTLKQI